MSIDSEPSLVARTILILLLVGIWAVGVNESRAKSSVTIPGTTWSTAGLFTIHDHGGRTQLNASATVFFGPQTIVTQSGTVILGVNEAALILSDEINEAELLGSYTINKKGKLGGITLQAPQDSIKQKLAAILERAYDAEFNGIVDIPNLQMKAVVKASKRATNLQINISGRGLLVGSLDGAPTESMLHSLTFREAILSSVGYGTSAATEPSTRCRQHRLMSSHIKWAKLTS
jgi:hypothetical protein